MVSHSYRHQRINLYNSTGKNCKTFRGYYHVFKPEIFDSKKLSKAAGQLPSMHLAIGSLVQLFTRNMYRFMEKRISWFEQKLVSKNVKEELKLWRNNINIYNGYTFKPRPLTSCLLFTYASDEGYGGFVLKHLNKETC